MGAIWKMHLKNYKTDEMHNIKVKLVCKMQVQLERKFQEHNEEFRWLLGGISTRCQRATSSVIKREGEQLQIPRDTKRPCVPPTNFGILGGNCGRI